MGLLEERENVIEQVRRAPSEAGADEVDALITALDVDEKSVRRSAAIALARVSGESPELLAGRTEALCPHLQREDPQVRGMVARAVADLAAVSPADAVPAASYLPACLDIDYDVTETTALAAVVRIVREDPAAGLELVPALRAVVDGDSNAEEATSKALLALVHVLPEDPSAVSPVVPTALDLLVTVSADGRPVEDVPEALGEFAEAEYEESIIQRASARKLAGILLARLAEERPDAVTSYVDDLASHLTDEDVLVRKAVVDALRAVAAERPSAMGATLPHLVEALARENDEAIAGRVAQTLGLASVEFPERLAAESERLVTPAENLLDSETPDVRVGAAGLLAALAEIDPRKAEPAIPALQGGLDDESDAVRGQVIWALRNVGAVSASEDLRRVSETDPNPDLRALANETLADFEVE